MPMENKRILIVEDQQDIANLLALHLGDLGAEVVVAADGHQGMRLSSEKCWDIMIIDIQLPGPSGLEICREVRRNQQYVPILLLTSRTSELDRVLGLDLGADDYVSKPFSVLELIARIKALLRRAHSLNPDTADGHKVICIRGLVVDESLRQVKLHDKVIELTAKEFDLLRYFISQPDRVFRRSELLDKVWGYGHEGYEHTVNSHINRLRGKIEVDPANPRIIATVWGVGYKLDSRQVPD